MARWAARVLPVFLLWPQLVLVQLSGIVKSAFQRDECAALIEAFQSMPSEVDSRQNPLLPHMEGMPFEVVRTNHFDDHSRPKWSQQLRASIFERARSMLIGHVPSDALRSVQAFSSMLDFTLMHEFHEGGAFDWHVDTKPFDGTGRTLNINVMLSSAGVDYTGGELYVGNESLAPSLGDLYVYSAALPHRVARLNHGSRFTLVVALTVRHLSASNDSPDGPDAPRAAYWQAIEEQFGQLLAGSLANEPKVHILYGEHLEAAGRADEAQVAFCHSYHATGAAVRYAQTFYTAGTQALREGQIDIELAHSYLSMAACVDPAHAEAVATLEVVREARQIVRGQQSSSRPDSSFVE